MRRAAHFDPEALLRRSEVGWYLEHDKEQRLEKFEKELNQLEGYLASDLEIEVDLPKTIVDKQDAFVPLIQTFVMPMTIEIRALVYCLLTGARIKSLNFAYKHREQAELEVAVEFGPNRSIKFRSTELWDAEVLHHLGLAKLSGKPFIDGYFSFGKA